MEKIDYQNPPPNWTSVVILWEDILNKPEYPISKILKWVETAQGGRYHLHGYDWDKGFDFRFENPHDALYFKLKWT